MGNIVQQIKEVIVVWFSCGAASAVAAKKTIERYGNSHEVVIVNNPIKQEHPDNQRFLMDVQTWLGQPIYQAINSKYPSCSCVEVWDDRQYMSGVQGAPCTMILKKQARYEWEIKNRPDWHVLGFTKEEKHRFNKFIKKERPNAIHILADTTKAECFQIILEAGLRLPEIYDLGYPNANCIGCVKATSPTYWNLTRKVFPYVFKERAEQSREIGCKLVKYKGQRIYLDELPENAKGRPIKNMNVECGIFCFKD